MLTATTCSCFHIIIRSVFSCMIWYMSLEASLYSSLPLRWMNIGIILCSRPVWLTNSSCCSSGWRTNIQFFHWDWEVVRWEAFQAPSQTANSNTANSNTAPRGSASTPVPPITHKGPQASLFLGLAVRMGPVQYPRWVLQKWPKSAKSKLVSVNLSLCYWTGIARIPVSVGGTIS